MREWYLSSFRLVHVCASVSTATLTLKLYRLGDGVFVCLSLQLGLLTLLGPSHMVELWFSLADAMGEAHTLFGISAVLMSSEDLLNDELTQFFSPFSPLHLTPCTCSSLFF